MVQVDLTVLEENQRMSFVRILSHLAKEHKIDGVILQDFDADLESPTYLSYLREHTEMAVIAQSKNVSSKAEVEQRLQAGAHVVQVYKPLFTDGPAAFNALL